MHTINHTTKANKRGWSLSSVGGGWWGLELKIAMRYVFSKKSHNAINIITGISMAGIAVATVAMVVVLSVFNGFHDLLEGLYTEFDPTLKAVPTEGKFFSEERTDSIYMAFTKHPQVAAVSRVVEDQALILFKGHPQVITVKGVDDNYSRVTHIKQLCYGNGIYQLHRAEVEYAIPGAGLVQVLGGPNFPHMQICAPRGGEYINLQDPLESLSVVEVDNTGLFFNVNQRKYDENYLITSLNLAQTLFEKEGQCTAFEIALKPGADIQKVKKELAKVLRDGETPKRGLEKGGQKGSEGEILDRLEQQESVFSIMQIEKLLAYVFLTFILLVACFNIISSVSMLIIEKSKDAQTLSHLGMPQNRLRRIFMIEGQLISMMGSVIGIVVGVALCLLQQYCGIISLGTGDNFIVQAYPVSVNPIDIGIIFLTTLIIGYLATWYPVRATLSQSHLKGRGVDTQSTVKTS